MKTTQIRGNILVALAVMLAGGASGVVISLAARAQVDTFGDRSEHGNPVEVDNRPYCVYVIEERGRDCPDLRDSNFICAPCVRPECPEYVHQQRGTNAIAGDPNPPGEVPPCLVGLSGGGGGCGPCPAGSVRLPVQRR